MSLARKLSLAAAVLVAIVVLLEGFGTAWLAYREARAGASREVAARVDLLAERAAGRPGGDPAALLRGFAATDPAVAAYVTDQAGRVLAHREPEMVGRDLSGLPQVAAALAATPEDRAGAEASGQTATGEPVIAAWRIVPGSGWRILAELPGSAVSGAVIHALLRSLGLLVFGVLLAVLGATLLARRLAAPIRRLQRGADRFGGGDLSQRVVLHTGDELELLANRFNQMGARLQDSYAAMQAKVAERTRELGLSLEQQTATAEVLEVISRSGSDLDTILRTLADTAARLCRSGLAQIFRRDGEVYRHWVSHNHQADYREIEERAAIEPGPGTLVGRVAVARRAVHIADCLADPGYALKEQARLGGLRTMLGVPLLSRGEPVGVFTVARSEVEPFTDRQIKLLTTFADQAVIAIENARLFEQVQARTGDLTEALEQQTATADVLKAISRSAFELDPVLRTLAESAARLGGGRRCGIFFLDGDVLRLQSHFGYTPEHQARLHEHPLRIGSESLVGRTVNSNGIVHIPDELLDPEFGNHEGRKVANARAFLGVPLRRDGKVFGVLSMNRPEPGPFSERQIQLVQTFADQAVIAIENARLFEEVQARTRELARSLEELREAQDRLVQTEKLASLGQLTAGIAHEIKNPLNFVNNFASLSVDLIEELREVLAGEALGNDARADVDELGELLKGNLEKVVSHGKRADSIVKNMLLHSREGAGDHRSVDVNALVEESVGLAYHGARVERPGFNVTLEKSLDPAVGAVDLYPQEITRVLLNLITNGFYASAKRQERAGEPGFAPVLAVSTRAIVTRELGPSVEIRVRDNGTGIPDEVKAKIFNPFFTTKPAGEGTGLGLSLSHDIVVKQHGGTIEVETEPGSWTEFTVILPREPASRRASQHPGAPA